MERAKYFILDVFANEKYQGNQLAVFINLKNISDNEMQEIAHEMNFSETTFVMANEDDGKGYPVRIFTPRQEVDFAGHPTLGTAWLIRNEIIGKPVESIVLHLKAGSIPVTFAENDILWMKQLEPKFGESFNKKIIAEILGLNISDIDDRFPIQSVSTGLPAIIVPLKTLGANKKIKINKEKYFELVANTEAKPILTFCPETYNKENKLNVRVFVDYYGIPEDPATGSGNGCLAGYLVKHKYFGSETIDITCEQGYEIHRPSKIYLKASVNKNNINVEVGGQVQLVASGNWH